MYKARPITNKAKGSPFKMSGEALVQNDAQTNKTFIDVAGSYGKGRDNALAHSPSNKQDDEGTKVPQPKFDNESASQASDSSPKPVLIAPKKK